MRRETIDRVLTIEERMRWGTCPVCGAEHGEPCDSDRGIPFGLRADGTTGRIPGAHLGRLNQAPRRVELPLAPPPRSRGLVLVVLLAVVALAGFVSGLLGSLGEAIPGAIAVGVGGAIAALIAHELGRTEGPPA